MIVRISYCIVCLFALHASAANFRSTQDGLWSDPATWGAESTPGDGDTVTIQHTVTADREITIGDSPVQSRATPAAITIQHKNRNSSGVLVVGGGAILTVRGDIRMESSGADHRAKFQMDAGAELRFDSSGASAPEEPVYSIYNAGPSGNYAAVYLHGSEEHPVIVRSVKTNGGGNHAFVRSLANSMDVRIHSARFEDCGTLNVGCIEHRISSGDGNDRLEMYHVIMDRTSGIKPTWFAQTSPANGGDIFLLRGVKTFNTISDPTLQGYERPQWRGSLAVNTETPLTDGIREISDCYFDMGMPQPSLLTGFTIRNNVFDRYPPALNASNGVIDSSKTWALAANNVYRALNVTARGVHGSFKDLYFYGDSRADNKGNPHGLVIGVKGDATVDGLIFEYGENPADPNGLIQQPYPAKGGPWNYTYTWKNNLFLPSSYFETPTKTSSIMVNHGLSALCPSMVIEHNTFMISGNFAQTNYLNETGIAPENCIAEFRSNLAWDVKPGRSYMITVNPDPRKRAASPPNALNPAGTDYNACWNCMVTDANRWPDSTSNGTIYDVPMRGAVPGSRDLVNQDPMFIDANRNIKRWVENRAGLEAGTGTASAAMNYLATGPGTMQERISDLIQWVREGFTPQNPAFRSAAHDGGSIGAVPFRSQE